MKASASTTRFFHLGAVLNEVEQNEVAGDLAICARLEEKGVPPETTKRLLNVLRSGGLVWSPKPHMYSRMWPD